MPIARYISRGSKDKMSLGSSSGSDSGTTPCTLIEKREAYTAPRATQSWVFNNLRSRQPDLHAAVALAPSVTMSISRSVETGTEHLIPASLATASRSVEMEDVQAPGPSATVSTSVGIEDALTPASLATARRSVETEAALTPVPSVTAGGSVETKALTPMRRARSVASDSSGDDNVGTKASVAPTPKKRCITSSEVPASPKTPASQLRSIIAVTPPTGYCRLTSCRGHIWTPVGATRIPVIRSSDSKHVQYQIDAQTLIFFSPDRGKDKRSSIPQSNPSEIISAPTGILPRVVMSFKYKQNSKLICADRLPSQITAMNCSASTAIMPDCIPEDLFKKTKEHLHIIARSLCPNARFQPQTKDNMVVGTKAANTQMMISELLVGYLINYFDVKYTVTVDYVASKAKTLTSDQQVDIRIAKNITCEIVAMNGSNPVINYQQFIDVFGCDDPPQTDFLLVSQAIRTRISEILRIQIRESLSLIKNPELDSDIEYAPEVTASAVQGVGPLKL